MSFSVSENSQPILHLPHSFSPFLFKRQVYVWLFTMFYVSLKLFSLLSFFLFSSTTFSTDLINSSLISFVESALSTSIELLYFCLVPELLFNYVFNIYSISSVANFFVLLFIFLKLYLSCFSVCFIHLQYLDHLYFPCLFCLHLALSPSMLGNFLLNVRYYIWNIIVSLHVLLSPQRDLNFHLAGS